MSRRTHARLRRTLCLTLRNARVTNCFYNNMRNTNTKDPCKMQSPRLAKTRTLVVTFLAAKNYEEPKVLRLALFEEGPAKAAGSPEPTDVTRG